MIIIKEFIFTLVIHSSLANNANIVESVRGKIFRGKTFRGKTFRSKTFRGKASQQSLLHVK